MVDSCPLSLPSTLFVLACLLKCILGATEISHLSPPSGWAHGYQLLRPNSCSNGLGMTADLHLLAPSPHYGPDIDQLILSVRHESEDRLHVHITSSGTPPRWEVPWSLLPRPILERESVCDSVSNGRRPALELRYSVEPFGFAVLRRATGEVLFNSTPDSTHHFEPVVFKNQYLELSTALPEGAALYGLGESTVPEGFRLHPGHTYTLFSSDIASKELGVDLYSSHPFYLDVREGGRSHGVFLLNSNGMDVLYKEKSLTYKVIGGVLDFYFFSGPTPLSVVQQYTALIGRPAPVPYWSLGWHQSRYGYRNIQELEDVVANYSAAKIPLDVMWSDIDYMLHWKDFTLDPVTYPENRTRAFVDRLHENDQHYIIIIDPGIKVERDYGPYERGVEMDIFITDVRGQRYIGQVWPGPVHFPDFLHPKIQSYWSGEIAAFHKVIPFDGLWIDMNEASNFCSGVVCDLPNHACPDGHSEAFVCCLVCNESFASIWDDPPYRFNNRGRQMPLNTKTIPLSAQHHGGILEYDAHSLYGLSEALVTNRALKELKQKRPFVLSRSTFPGSGVHTIHWTGDNDATWYDMVYSIPQILNFGLFGIPMVGADICGYTGPTTEELCLRWVQLGAFYPFARDHSDIHSTAQEPYRWESVAQTARKVLALRYRLLPMLYTLVYESHTFGFPIARPLFFAFSDDPNTLDINKQFLLGNNILVSPVLLLGADSVEAYFPKGTWYSLFNYSDMVVSMDGSWVTLNAPLDTIPVHVRDGSIVAMQEPAMTTASARRTNFTLVVAFAQNDDSQSASGQLFLDDGEAKEMVLSVGSSSLITFEASLLQGKFGALWGSVQHSEFALTQGWVLDQVILLGVHVGLSELKIGGMAILSRVHVESDGPSLTIKRLNCPLGKDFILTWSTSASHADSD